MALPILRRVWVAAWPSDRGGPSGLVSFCMRFDKDAAVPHSDVLALPRSREDLTPEQHVRFGLLDERDLLMIRDAIDKYLDGRYLEDMAEHTPSPS